MKREEVEKNIRRKLQDNYNYGDVLDAIMVAFDALSPEPSHDIGLTCERCSIAGVYEKVTSAIEAGWQLKSQGGDYLCPDCAKPAETSSAFDIDKRVEYLQRAESAEARVKELERTLDYQDQRIGQLSEVKTDCEYWRERLLRSESKLASAVDALKRIAEKYGDPRPGECYHIANEALSRINAGEVKVEATTGGTSGGAPKGADVAGAGSRDPLSRPASPALPDLAQAREVTDARLASRTLQSDRAAIDAERAAADAALADAQRRIEKVKIIAREWLMIPADDARGAQIACRDCAHEIEEVLR
jgi:uncharacterized coiled-coil protein SlyX